MKRNPQTSLGVWSRTFCYLALVVAGLAACMEDPVPPKVVGPGVVALVNQQPVSKERLARELVLNKRKFRIHKNEKISLEKLVWLRNNTLNEIIKETVLLQEARKRQVVLDQDEFNIHLNNDGNNRIVR